MTYIVLQVTFQYGGSGSFGVRPKLKNIDLTIITLLRGLSPSYLLFLVRLGDYTVNLYVLFFYKLIGKLTVFL